MFKTPTQIRGRVGVSFTGIYRDPSIDSALETQALFGESLAIVKTSQDWLQVVTDLDEYSGYMKTSDVIQGLSEAATHRVSERTAGIYNQSDFKKRITGTLYLNSLVTVVRTVKTPEGPMCEVHGLGWVFARRLVPIGYKAPDFVSELLKLGDAEQGVEYGWGWRSSLFDCSSAVQSACIAAGIPCPRDSMPQSKMLGKPVTVAVDYSDLRRGDLLFWTELKGRHVVVMVDSKNCFNVTVAEPYGRAIVQPLAQVIFDQQRNGNGQITIVRRLHDYRPT